MPEIEHSTEYKAFLESIKLNGDIANAFIRNSIAVDYKEVDISEVTWKYYADTDISTVFVMDIPCERWLLEVLVCRNIDTFQYYITRILRQIFKNYPDVDKKVHDVFRGLPLLVEYLNKELGLNFNTTMLDFQAACELVEVRNIIVHHAGRVSKLFLRRTGRKDIQLDTLYSLTKNDVLKMTDKLCKVAEELDLQIVSKFKLRQDSDS